MQPESGQNVQLEDCSSLLQNIVQHVLSSTILSFPDYMLAYVIYIFAYVIYLCDSYSFEAEPYSAQWAYLAAINRSAGVLSLTEGEVIMRTILILSPISTMNEINGVCSYKAGCYIFT